MQLQCDNIKNNGIFEINIYEYCSIVSVILQGILTLRIHIKFFCTNQNRANSKMLR